MSIPHAYCSNPDCRRRLASNERGHCHRPACVDAARSAVLFANTGTLVAAKSVSAVGTETIVDYLHLQDRVGADGFHFVPKPAPGPAEQKTSAAAKLTAPTFGIGDVVRLGAWHSMKKAYPDDYVVKNMLGGPGPSVVMTLPEGEFAAMPGSLELVSKAAGWPNAGTLCMVCRQRWALWFSPATGKAWCASPILYRLEGGDVLIVPAELDARVQVVHPARGNHQMFDPSYAMTTVEREVLALRMTADTLERLAKSMESGA